MYDLENRTLAFSQNLIWFLKACPKNNITFSLINQCLRAGTSIGANYREANGASSKKEFYCKIFICKKESKETFYWLELLEKTIDDERCKDACRPLQMEAKEFMLIFGKIAASGKVNLLV